MLQQQKVKKQKSYHSKSQTELIWLRNNLCNNKNIRNKLNCRKIGKISEYKINKRTFTLLLNIQYGIFIQK